MLFKHIHRNLTHFCRFSSPSFICTCRYHAGGWGKPPVDATGRPIYGDVFGKSEKKQGEEEEVDKTTLWGQMDEEEEEEEEEEDSEEEEDGEGEEGEGLGEGEDEEEDEANMDGIESVAPTPVTIDLRKQGTDTPQVLYKVLDEKKVSVSSGALYGSR